MPTAIQTRFDDAQPIAIPLPATTSRETRNASHRALRGVSQSQQAVLSLLASGPRTDRQIAAALGWDRCSVNGRRHELVAAGLVAQAGVTTDPQSGRTVALWRAVVR